jgi:tryptophan-rich sensory protein
MKEIHWGSLLFCVGGIVLIGSISGLANVGNITGWFATINKPSFNPPNYLFGPVWTMLYILMGISLYLILQSPKTDARNTALIIFAFQMALNFSWSFLFFYFKWPGIAFIEIIIMWIAIIMMIMTFYQIKPLAAYLQVPYFLWVSFASVLNGAIWYLNK